MAPRPKYRRVLLKLSGEAFGREGAGLQLDSNHHLRAIAQQIAAIHRSKIQLAVVIGGGNFIRGKSLRKAGITPVAADTMGMIATVINGVALQDVLESLGVNTRLQTAFPMQAVAEPYIRRRCIRHLEKGRVVILTAGTGSPHFTTDTAAALRAREIGADALLKATNVDGVYSADPKTDPHAKRLLHVTYDRVIHDKLQVMDATAITLCREGNLPIIVFNMTDPNNIRRAVAGRNVGTYIGEK
jgi:uridylate kinase